MTDGEWTWQCRAPANRADDDLVAHVRARSTDTLDEIVTDWWRDPDDSVAPLPPGNSKDAPVGGPCPVVPQRV